MTSDGTGESSSQRRSSAGRSGTCGERSSAVHLAPLYLLTRVSTDADEPPIGMQSRSSFARIPGIGLAGLPVDRGRFSIKENGWLQAIRGFHRNRRLMALRLNAARRQSLGLEPETREYDERDVADVPLRGGESVAANVVLVDGPEP